MRGPEAHECARRKREGPRTERPAPGTSGWIVRRPARSPALPQTVEETGCMLVLRSPRPRPWSTSIPPCVHDARHLEGRGASRSPAFSILSRAEFRRRARASRPYGLHSRAERPSRRPPAGRRSPDQPLRASLGRSASRSHQGTNSPGDLPPRQAHRLEARRPPPLRLPPRRLRVSKTNCSSSCI